MKSKLLCIGLVGLTALGTGCKKSAASRYGREEPIKGSRSDPAVAMQVVWAPTNRYHFHLESITAADEPRRNTTELVTRETTFGQDFALAVTNVAENGSRILEMEIQGLQLDSALGERVTISFDSGNESLDMNGAPVAERLQKIIGSRLALHLTPDNRVRRIDGLREINDRLTDRPNTNTTRNVVRGAAGNVLSRFFTMQYLRDLLDMSAVPTNEVRVGDTWTVSRSVPVGASGGSAMADLTYIFKGWQEHDNRRCARFEFTGKLKPPPPANPRLRDVLRGPTGPPPQAPPDATGEIGTINGVTWFSPDLGLPVETVFDQSTTSKMTTTRRTAVKVVRGTNTPPGTVDTNPPPVVVNVDNPAGAVNVITTNTPPETVTATIRQHLNFKLVDVTAFTPPTPKQ